MASISAERDVDIVAQEAPQRHVPSTPEGRQVPLEVWIIEILADLVSGKAASGDRDVVRGGDDQIKGNSLRVEAPQKLCLAEELRVIVKSLFVEAEEVKGHISFYECGADADDFRTGGAEIPRRAFDEVEAEFIQSFDGALKKSGWEKNVDEIFQRVGGQGLTAPEIEGDHDETEDGIRDAEVVDIATEEGEFSTGQCRKILQDEVKDDEGNSDASCVKQFSWTPLQPKQSVI